MGIEIAIILLTYVTILVMSYMIIIFMKEKNKRVIRIINQAYQNAFSIFLFSLLVVIALIKLPHITLNNQTTSYLILISKLISVLTLGASIFIQNRNK
jgi:nucleoside recognition membrane protein YjiH